MKIQTLHFSNSRRVFVQCIFWQSNVALVLVKHPSFCDKRHHTSYIRLTTVLLRGIYRRYAV